VGALDRLATKLSDEEWRYVAAGGMAFLGLVTWALGFRTMRVRFPYGDRACPVEIYEQVLVAEHDGKAKVARRAWEYEPILVNAALHFGAPPVLLMGMAHTESTFQPHAESSAGAVGLVQIMPNTAKSLHNKLVDAGEWPFLELDRKDPEQSAWMAAYHMADMLKRREVENALAAYNAGGSRVRPDTPKSDWPSQTRSYVKGVLRRAGYYREIWNRCGGVPF